MIAEIEQYMATVKIDKSIHTVSSYTTAIKKFVDNMNIISFDDLKNITPVQCRNHQGILRQTLSASSTNANIRPLRAMYNWFVENEYMEVSPWSKVKDLKQPKTIPNFLTEEEVGLMIGACENIKEKLIIALLITTGLRRNELISLKMSDVVGNHILINGKGNKQRRLVLQPGVLDLLKKYMEKRIKKYGTDSPYLLLSNGGKRPYAGVSIACKIKSIMKRAGFTEERMAEIHTHSLRHTFVANLFESGADIYAAQSALGHSNLNTTQRYAHLRNSALDNAMLKQKSIL